MNVFLVMVMPPYLIEIRMFGSAKKQMKDIIHELCLTYEIKTLGVPHITLVGPFDTRAEHLVIRTFESVCSNFKNLAYMIDDVKTFRSTGVVYLNVIPNQQLRSFRKTLYKSLKPCCEFPAIENEFVFHATVANHVSEQQLNAIKYNVPKMKFQHVVMRVTLLKNGHILREYDLLLRRSLNRYEALNWSVMQQTWNALGYTKSTNELMYQKETLIQKARRILGI